jgi:hypothetical protein
VNVLKTNVSSALLVAVALAALCLALYYATTGSLLPAGASYRTSFSPSRTPDYAPRSATSRAAPAAQIRGIIIDPESGEPLARDEQVDSNAPVRPVKGPQPGRVQQSQPAGEQDRQ